MIFEDDYDWYRSYFGGDRKLSETFRKVLRTFRKQIEAQQGRVKK